MECNKDEAERSKGIAEAKFLQNDFVGAKKFAFKAKQLFPELDGLAQLIAVLDVHLTAQVKLQGGEMNWYGILQVDSKADEFTIRKQYRRLALILHPDKNKSVGAEAAFKYISEAWGVLSDKTKKAAHDNKLHPKPPSSKMAPTKDPLSNANGFRRPPTASASQHHPARASRPTMSSAQPPPTKWPPPPPPPSPPQQLSSTFWTACPSCRMQFEYQRMYVNKNLCCPICYKGFYAVEVPFVNGITLWSLKDHHVLNTDASKYSKSSTKAASASNTSFPWSCFGNGTANPPGQPQMSTNSSKENVGAHQSTRMKQTDINSKEVKEKDNITAKLAAHLNEFRDQLREKSKGLNDLKTSLDKSFNAGCEVNAAACRHSQPGDVPMSERETAPGLASKQIHSDLKCGGKENLAAHGKAGLGQRDGHEPVNSSPDTRHAKRSASSKRGEEQSASPVKKAKTDGEIRKAVDSKSGRSEGHTSVPTMASGSSSLSMPSSADRQCSETGANAMNENADIMNVPDADFYDFDQDRTENHFCAGQIWAVYDDDDALPRYYAQISKVYSYKPFKLQITWLEPLSPSDEIRNWIDSGFSYTCGEFKLGTTMIVKTVNMFSHMVTFEKRSKGGFKIYPRKGDVWALYKDWKNMKQNNASHDFDMAEVLTDYADEAGVQVSFLTKIEGFKSIFQRQLGDESVHWVVPGDLRRFSHQIPTNRLMSDIPGVQEGCLELDPASTPLNLIAGH